MRKTLHIARREFIETVRTRAFLASVVLAPLIITAVLFFIGRSEEALLSSRPARHVVLVDRSGLLADDARGAFEHHNRTNANRPLVLEVASFGPNGPEEALRRAKDRLRLGAVDAVADVAAGALDGQGGLTFITGPVGATDLIWHETVQRLVDHAAFLARCRREGLSAERISALRRSLPLEHLALGADRAETKKDPRSGLMTMMVPFAFLMLMYMGVVSTGQIMVTSVVEEKTSRIMEVLLSAVTPLQLMAGKILGLGAVGLLLIGSWIAAGWGASAWRGIDLGLSATLVACFAVYYLLGYLLYAAILAGLGSVCSTLREAQSLVMPVVMIMVIPIMGWFNLSQDPNGVLARVFSYVPVTTSMLMMLRLTAGGGLWAGEIVLSMLALVGWNVAALWASARLFRVGVLMYGKRPSPREILRWIRRG
ncbi:MAG: ABC transporter permease [Planctomycetes bacterium]|nr:ABC transporter permease [Planctomycetota bacterium]